MAVRPRAAKKSTSSRARARKPSIKKIEEKAARNKPLPLPLTGKQKRHLRALAHPLEPVIQVGLKGLSESLIEETKAALAAHELIKVRIGKNAPDEISDAASKLAVSTKAELVQTIGKVVVLYRAAEDVDRRRIVLPKS